MNAPLTNGATGPADNSIRINPAVAASLACQSPAPERSIADLIDLAKANIGAKKQGEIAAAIGRSDGQLSNAKKGVTTLSAEPLAKLMELAGVGGAEVAVNDAAPPAAPVPVVADAEPEPAANSITDDQDAQAERANLSGFAVQPRQPSRRESVGSDLERVREALSFIPPDDRETWVRMAFAVKSELGEAGRAIWDTWSQQADSYTASAAREVWKSASATGGVKGGTLFHEAKLNGWRDESYVPPSPAELAERQRQADEQAARDAAEVERQQIETARHAALIWEQATSADGHPYLIRKAVESTETLRQIDVETVATLIGYRPQASGERLTGRLLVVPIKRDGKLTTLELIDGEGRKAALKGKGTKTGGYWAAQAMPAGDGEGMTILIGEGVATALSAREATRHPVVAALSVSNFSKTLKALHARYPKATLMVLADVDKTTGRPDSKFFGPLKETAIACGALLAAPDFGTDRPEGATDFNDLHQARGLDVVREQIEGARLLGTEQTQKRERDICSPAPDSGYSSSSSSSNSSDDDQEPVDALADAIAKAKKSIELADQDPGAPYDEIEAWRLICRTSSAEYARLRAALKRCKEVSIIAFEREVRETGTGDDPASKADELVELAQDRCTLFHDADLEPYASFTRDGHRETWPLYSKGFGEWLSYLSYTETGTAPTDTTIKVVLATLAGVAKFDGEESAVHLRVACLEQGKRYCIDLCDEQWRVVEITPQGWHINPHPSTLFIRTNSMRPLPCPDAQGDLSQLWPLVNVPEDDRLLILAWMLESFRPETPYAVLALLGEQGSVKSSTQNALRELIDPNRANLRAAPKTVEDLYVSAFNSHLWSMENISHLSPPFQDALCVLATGGGFAGRTLFTNRDETVMDLRRPIILNGIAAAVTAQDLADRTIQISCPEIEKRRTSGAVNAEFEAARSAIFGGLLDLFASVLAILPSVEIDPVDLPRMADFAHIGEAVYRHHGKPAGTFLSDYAERRKDAVHRTLDSIPTAAAIIAYLEKFPRGMHGETVKAAWCTLAMHKTGEDGWPKSAKGFSDSLRRVSPSLRMIGIRAKVSDQRTKHGYTVDICFQTPNSGNRSSSSSSSAPQRAPGAVPDELGEHGEHGNPLHSAGNIYPERKNDVQPCTVEGEV